MAADSPIDVGTVTIPGLILLQCRLDASGASCNPGFKVVLNWRAWERGISTKTCRHFTRVLGWPHSPQVHDWYWQSNQDSSFREVCVQNSLKRLVAARMRCRNCTLIFFSQTPNVKAAFFLAYRNIAGVEPVYDWQQNSHTHGAKSDNCGLNLHARDKPNLRHSDIAPIMLNISPGHPGIRISRPGGFLLATGH